MLLFIQNFHNSHYVRERRPCSLEVVYILGIYMYLHMPRHCYTLLTEIVTHISIQRMPRIYVTLCGFGITSTKNFDSVLGTEMVVQVC